MEPGKSREFECRLELAGEGFEAVDEDLEFDRLSSSNPPEGSGVRGGPTSWLDWR